MYPRPYTSKLEASIAMSVGPNLGVFLLVAMGIGGAISFALRKDPGDTPMRAGSAHPSTPTPRAATSAGNSMNLNKVAAVLSSTLFFLGSCTGITLVSIPALKHIGGKGQG